VSHACGRAKTNPRNRAKPPNDPYRMSWVTGNWERMTTDRCNKDREIKLVEFAIVAFKRLQRQGETELYSDEEIAAGAMDALIYRAGYEKFGADKEEVAAAFHSVYLTREDAQPGGFISDWLYGDEMMCSSTVF
jgi:hypothetical protein